MEETQEGSIPAFAFKHEAYLSIGNRSAEQHTISPVFYPVAYGFFTCIEVFLPPTETNDLPAAGRTSLFSFLF